MKTYEVSVIDNKQSQEIVSEVHTSKAAALKSARGLIRHGFDNPCTVNVHEILERDSDGSISSTGVSLFQKETL